MTLYHSSGRLRLIRRDESPIPLDLDGITPDRVATLSLLEVAKLPIYHGNRREELGLHFDIDGNPAAGWLQIGGDTCNVKCIGAGMTGGMVYIENDAGAHVGARMTGGEMILDASAGDWLGAEMKGGSIVVRGSAGDQVGAAYRGSRRGMTGGVITILGWAGDEVGLLMRRGLIICESCGEFAGASMIAGSIFVRGKAGNRIGAGMKRGTIFAGGGVDELPPSFRHSCDYLPTFLALYFRELAAPEVPTGTRWPEVVALSLVRCYRGDLLNGGRGEILVPVGS